MVQLRLLKIACGSATDLHVSLITAMFEYGSGYCALFVGMLHQAVDDGLAVADLWGCEEARLATNCMLDRLRPEMRMSRTSSNVASFGSFSLTSWRSADCSGHAPH